MRFVPLLLVWNAVSNAQSPKVGEPAPEILLDRTIPAGAGVSWSALRGRPVVVEFWATWCANCVAEIPKLNELASKFPEIQFISITDEAASAVEPFLAKRPISGWVGIDRGGATFRAYGVEARPRTFFIDRNGVVRAAMHPAQVSEATIADLAADRPVKTAGMLRPPMILSEAGDDPVFAVMLRPSRSPKPGGVFGVDSGQLQGNNINLRTIVAYAYSVTDPLLEGPEPLMSLRYDFCVMLPEGVPDDRLLLRQMIERSFQLKIRRDPRMEDTIVLKTAGGRPPSGGIPIMAVARRLEAQFKRVVVDETRIESFPFFAFPEDRDELVKALRSRLGIELVFEKRPVEHLVVESIQLPTYRTR